MKDNVSEMTLDDWSEEFTSEAITDPLKLYDDGKYEIRGCSWRNFEKDAKAEYRFGGSQPNDHVGFRCVKTLPLEE